MNPHRPRPSRQTKSNTDLELDFGSIPHRPVIRSDSYRRHNPELDQADLYDREQEAQTA
jgi:hypothetical protein